jgi:Protein of unknown function (DUF1064)
MPSGLRFSEEEFQALRTRLAAQNAPKTASNGPRARKYGNTKVQTSNGQKFDSKRELKRFNELTHLQAAGHITDLKTQVRFELVPKQEKPGGGCERPVHYVADFVYFTKGGEQVVEDTKGFRTPDYVIKRKLMLSVHKIQIQEV